MLFKKNHVSYALITSGLIFSSVSAYAFNASNAQQLRNAIRQAKNNGPGRDVINVTGNFADNGTIVIDTPVLIDGGNRANTIIRNQDSRGPVLAINSSNVTVRNITVNSPQIQGFNIGIQLRGGVVNTRIVNSRFTGHASAIDMGQAAPPRNLTVSGNRFVGNTNAIWLRRDTGRSAGSDPLLGGLYRIVNNFVNGAGGFVIDNGNDGSDFVNGQATFRGPGFTGSNLSPSATIYRDGSRIANNTMINITAFGVGLAKCDNLDVLGNTISMTTATRFGGAIQLEHRTRNIRIANNTLNTVSGKGGLHLVSFSDHGAPRRFRNGVRNIFVTDNKFSGGGTAILGSGFSGVRAVRNDFRMGNLSFFINNIPGGTSSFSRNANNLGVSGGRIPNR